MPRTPLYRRWQAAALLLVILAVVVGIVAVNRFVWAYHPLEPGSYSGVSGARRLAEEPFADESDGGPHVAVRYRSGRTFAIQFSIHNGGSRSVTVTGFPGFGDLYVAEQVGIDLDGDEGDYRGGTPQHWEPFAPFNIDPNEERVVRLRYRFREGCTMQLSAKYDRGQFEGGTVIDSIPVGYEYLGVDRVSSLPMRSVLGLEALGTCP